MAKKKCCGGVLLVVGLLGTLVYAEADLTDQHSMEFEKLEKPMIPVLMKFTFWNVENPDDIKQGALPKLKEKGPYVYEETREKRNMTFQNDIELITYGLYKQWNFRKDLSCDVCNEDDEVTILNMPLIGGIYVAAMQSDFIERAILGNINKAMQGEHVYGLEDGCCNDTLFFTKGVNDLLFGGVRDGIVKFLLDYSLTNDPNLLPPQFDFEDRSFAFMNPRNGTQDNEWYQVNTGKISWERSTMIEKWGPQPDDMHGNLEHTDPFWWPSRGYKGRDSCTKLEGTDGHQFPPFINKDKKWTFQTDLCRSMPLIFEKNIEINGIMTYRFTSSAESQWMNRTDNFCFYDQLGELYDGTTDVYDPCIKETDDPEILDIKDCSIKIPGAKGVDGIQDLHHCLQTPLYVTQPHFYQAEAELDNIAEGMNPDAEQHAFHIDVEPNTGFVIRLRKRVQFNMPLQKNAYIDELNNVSELVFPVLWIDEGFDV